MVWGELSASLVTVTVAVRAPVAVGVNVTLMVQVAAAANGAAVQSSVFAKSPAEIATVAMVSGRLPVLVTVTV